MNVRTMCEGGFTLPMRPEKALTLFTPEGERIWAGDDWDPVYPVPSSADDDAAPGTVFTTDSDGHTAFWVVVIGGRDGTMRYARVVPDRIAGTITVTCSPSSSADKCRVTVEYDVTSLGPEGVAFVQELQAGYDGFLESWREEILAALERNEAPTR